MPKNEPSQLRLYVEHERATTEPGDRDSIDRLCQAFQEITGCELTFHAEGALQHTTSTASLPLTLPPRGTGQPILELALPADGLGDLEPSGRAADYRRFAETVGELVGALHSARQALRDREGELAAAIPLICEPREESRQIAQRLAAVLRAGVEAVGCTAGALYVLDDFTQHLKLRSHWGLSDDRFTDPPRNLRDATADLEALIGHAVVLEKPKSFEAWNAPAVGFGSAVCVPVSTATVPLGTLWFFHDKPRTYDDREVNLIEVIAGRLAVELEREVLLRTRIETQGIDESLIRDWQKLAWQTLPEPPGWLLAAAQARRTGCPLVACCTSVTSSRSIWPSLRLGKKGSAALMNAGLIGAARRSVLRRSPQRQAAYLDQLAGRVSFEQRPLASWCGEVDLETGSIDYTQTGTMETYIIRPHAWESLPGSEPCLADAPERTYTPRRAALQSGDTLLVIAAGRTAPEPLQVRGPEGRDATPIIDGPHLAELTLRHAHQHPQEILRLLQALLHRHTHPWATPPGLVLVHRQ